MRASTLLSWAVALAALLALALPATATAAYPDKPVRMIVVFPAGGTTDLIARAVQPAFAKALGQEIVVKNTGGGGGTIGTAEIAAAGADGYTIGVAPIGPTTTQPHLRRLPYNTLEDLAPVCRIYNSPVVLATTKDSRFRTVDDLVRYARDNPNDVVFGSPAPGSIPHVVLVALMDAAGIKMKHIPFAGTAPGMKALLGGTIQLWADVANFVPQYDLHAIAVYGEKRLKEFPGLPTMKEQGYDLVFSIWGGMFAPAGISGDKRAVLSRACKQALEAPRTIEAMRKQAAPINYLDAEAFTAFVRAEFKKNGRVLAAAGLKK